MLDDAPAVHLSDGTFQAGSLEGPHRPDAPKYTHHQIRVWSKLWPHSQAEFEFIRSKQTWTFKPASAGIRCAAKYKSELTRVLVGQVLRNTNR